MFDFFGFCLIRKYTKYSLNLTFGGECNDTPSLIACETLWTARQIALVAHSTERERRTENVFQMLLRYKTEVSIIATTMKASYCGK